MTWSWNPLEWHIKAPTTGRKGVEEGAITRRGVLKTVMAAVATAPLINLAPKVTKTENRTLIRPPFSRYKEEDFLSTCIRCGKCMEVCVSNTLQPAYFEAGAEGLMTPVIKPEIAGCEGTCNACGQVCPTNAIFPFTREEKFSMKMGTAKLELDRCIGYTENVDCNECVKVCPTQAIKIDVLDGVPKPVIIEASQCTGCGSCETACNTIVTNNSACVTTNKGRGLPTDMLAIQKTLDEKKNAGKGFLPRV